MNSWKGNSSCYFWRKGVNNSPCLDFLISLILKERKKDSVPFTKGVNFWFPAICVSSASSMAKDRLSFLRIAIEEESEKEMEKFVLKLKGH